MMGSPAPAATSTAASGSTGVSERSVGRPHSRSACSTSTRHEGQASPRAVAPPHVAMAGLAPLRSSARATPSCPLATAHMKGVCPSDGASSSSATMAALTRAPMSRSFSTLASSPRMAAYASNGMRTRPSAVRAMKRYEGEPPNATQVSSARRLSWPSMLASSAASDGSRKGSSNATTRVKPPCSASSIALGIRSSTLKLAVAPWDSSSDTMSAWPRLAACMRAVNGGEGGVVVCTLASMSLAPVPRRKATIPTWPCAHAVQKSLGVTGHALLSRSKKNLATSR